MHIQIAVPMYPYNKHSTRVAPSATLTPDASQTIPGATGDVSYQLQDEQQIHQLQPPPLKSSLSMTRTLAHYQRHEQIGQGTYGQVYRATCLDTNQVVALKKVRPHHGSHTSGMPQQLIREVKILKRLRHINIMRLHEVVTSKGVEHLDPPDNSASTSAATAASNQPSGPSLLAATAGEQSANENSNKPFRDSTIDARESYKGNLFLVLEYVPHDLTGLIDIQYLFTPLQIKIIFYQLLQAIRYLHDQSYIHRDIKSSNILLDDNLRLKLADFGLARSVEPPLLDQLHQDYRTAVAMTSSSFDMTNKVITLWYRPPEILLGAVQYGPPVDVFSAGCIMAELSLGKPIFCGKTEMEQLSLLVDILGTPSEDTWEYLQSMKKVSMRSGSSSMPSESSLPTIDMSRPKPSRLREKYEHRLTPVALNLLEKLLDWDPRKRLTAANALTHRYFWTEPAVPPNPADWGRIHVPGGHFHEFQTKKKRKQAKAQAEKTKEEALLKGLSEEEAKAASDDRYKALMKMVAEDGYDAFDKNGLTQAEREREHKNHSPATSSRDTDEGRGSKRHGSGSRRDDDRESKRKRTSSGERRKGETSEERRRRRAREKEANARNDPWRDATASEYDARPARSSSMRAKPREEFRLQDTQWKGDAPRTNQNISISDNFPLDERRPGGREHADNRMKHDDRQLMHYDRVRQPTRIEPTIPLHHVPDQRRRDEHTIPQAEDVCFGTSSRHLHDLPPPLGHRNDKTRATTFVRPGVDPSLVNIREQRRRSYSPARPARDEAYDSRGRYLNDLHREEPERHGRHNDDRKRDDRRSSRDRDRRRDDSSRRHSSRERDEEGSRRERSRDRGFHDRDDRRSSERGERDRSDGRPRTSQSLDNSVYYGKSSHDEERRNRDDIDRRRGDRDRHRDRDSSRHRKGHERSRGGTRSPRR
ncbi:hypothetical protein MPSEU_000816900 [Mayamaea pseudoterrestris]|nr:hypothetical protein MPSEU_000816900 [Mayamaea pseudoterrestris]